MALFQVEDALVPIEVMRGGRARVRCLERRAVHRDTHIWFEVRSDDPPQVVQDGDLIRGTRCRVEHHTNGTTFVSRSDYVIRRLRPGDESSPPPLHEGSCL